MTRVVAVVADDEPLLRAQLRSRLSRLWPELDVVKEMENGRDVESVIEEHSPALFFLDIHMPGVNGLEAARLIGGRAHVVFVTAFDQYAVEAFEEGAVDCLYQLTAGHPYLIQLGATALPTDFAFSASFSSTSQRGNVQKSLDV